MANGDAPECDFSMLLSQEIIAKVMEEYLNKTMLRQQVEVVDLQNNEAGYVFSLKYRPKVKVIKPLQQRKLDQAGGFMEYDVYVGGTGVAAQKQMKVGRTKNGRFASTQEVLSHG